MGSPVRTVHQLVDEHAANFPDNDAIVSEDRTITFGDLAYGSRNLARGLKRHGIGKGDVVALWLVNEPDWLTLFIACARIGANVLAVNTRFRETELADILTRLKPKAIAYRPRFKGIDFAGIYNAAAGLADSAAALRIEFGGAEAADAVSFDDLPIVQGGEIPADAAGDADLVMFTTSGTTSAPKFVQHTNQSVVSHARDVARDFGMSEPDSVMMQALPYAGVFGFCQAMAALAAGRPSIVTETFDAAATVASVAAHRVTHFNATDEMLTACAAEGNCRKAFESLRLVGAASFNRGADRLRELARDTGAPIVGLYGLSEGQALFARRRTDDPPDVRYCGGGRPVARDGRYRVRNPATGELAPPGEPGELEIRASSLFSRYAGDPRATSEAFTGDGFLRTGDLGILDVGTGFTFLARLGDAVRLGGYLVNPDEISGFIETTENVGQCVVVAVEIDGKTRPVAFIVPAPDGNTDKALILRRCRQSLAPYKVPADIFTLDTFPVATGPNGQKIQRGELRKMARRLIEG